MGFLQIFFFSFYFLPLYFFPKAKKRSSTSGGAYSEPLLMEERWQVLWERALELLSGKISNDSRSSCPLQQGKWFFWRESLRRSRLWSLDKLRWYHAHQCVLRSIDRKDAFFTSFRQTSAKGGTYYETEEICLCYDDVGFSLLSCFLR